MQYTNILAYKFVVIDEGELGSLKTKVKDFCLNNEFKGTVILSPEGINIALAGPESGITAFKEWLAEDDRFSSIDYKDSDSDYQPYNRLLVKIKKEIIAMGLPEIQPQEFTGKNIAPNQLKEWLDQNKEITLLDVRNEYEIQMGTFDQAKSLNIDVFRAFPKALAESQKLDKSKPIVTFCTGGIRCEKASALMLNRGYNEVYQLEGGILRYFEECGEEHYNGECFVYDQRVCLNAQLEETSTVQCFNCISPVTSEEQLDPTYVPTVSCPHCINGKPKKETVK